MDCLVDCRLKVPFKLSSMDPFVLSRIGLVGIVPSGVKKLALLEEDGTRPLVVPMDKEPKPPPSNSTSLVASATAENFSKKRPEPVETEFEGIPPDMEAEPNKLLCSLWVPPFWDNPPRDRAPLLKPNAPL
jgi:hypothetical protein